MIIGILRQQQNLQLGFQLFDTLAGRLDLFARHLTHLGIVFLQHLFGGGLVLYRLLPA